jgi:hypothetical protein
LRATERALNKGADHILIVSDSNPKPDCGPFSRLPLALDSSVP